MIAVDRSVQSSQSDSFSAPITSTCRELPARTRSAAAPTPKQNPAQAAFRSNAPGAGMPIRSAVCAAAFGIGLGIVQVATMTVSISVGASPASFTARAPASMAMSTSSGALPRRCAGSAMPTRSRIHWSLVSMRCGQVVVGDDVVGLGAAQAEEAGARDGGGQAQWVRVLGHECSSACSLISSTAASRSSGVLRASVRDALQLALGEADQGAGGRQLEDRGDPALAQGRRAGVPAHRAG